MQQAGQNPQQQILIGEPPVQAMEEQQNNECHPWPEEIPAQQLALAQGVNLNLAPPILEQDLNELPMAEDSQEILIHPMAQENPQANNAFPDDMNKADAELRRLPQLHPNSSALIFDVFKVNDEDMMARPIHSDGEEVRTSCPTCFNNHIPFPIPLTRTSPLLYYYYI